MFPEVESSIPGLNTVDAYLFSGGALWCIREYRFVESWNKEVWFPGEIMDLTKNKNNKISFTLKPLEVQQILESSKVSKSLKPPRSANPT